jgi:23S rRNA pseudouridine1911/1915/1917 synthase
VPYPFTAEVTVENYLHGVRIDSFLVRHFRNYTPFRMQRMVRAGQVKIEGMRAATDDRVYKGQSVEVRLIEPPDHLLESEPLPLEILFEDPWIVAVNKPADLVAHPCGNYSSGSLANALQAHFNGQTELRGLIRPGIVHRLDRLTSGVMVCTKEHVAHRRLSIDFQESRVRKEYLALVNGVVKPDEGEATFPIGKTPGGGTIKMSIAADSVDPRSARTKFTVVERFARHTLVLAQPYTGRLHQIRLHMMGIGHPVASDEFYSHSAVLTLGELFGGDPAIYPPRVRHQPPETILMSRQALHAHRLVFMHPIRCEPVTIVAELPEDMRQVLELLRAGR